MEKVNNTQYFKFNLDTEVSVKDILDAVYDAMEEKGYNPVNQIVGYIMSGDPTYITSHKNARSMIMKVERDELVEELLKEYKTSNNKNELNKQLNDIALSYGYSEYDMHKYVKKPYEYFNKKLGSQECQKIATRAFKAIEKLRYHQADKVAFKNKIITCRSVLMI